MSPTPVGTRPSHSVQCCVRRVWYIFGESAIRSLRSAAELALFIARQAENAVVVFINSRRAKRPKRVQHFKRAIHGGPIPEGKKSIFGFEGITLAEGEIPSAGQLVVPQ